MVIIANNPCLKQRAGFLLLKGKSNQVAKGIFKKMYEMIKIPIIATG